MQMATVIAGLSIFIVSCKDDDKTSSEQEQEQQAEQDLEQAAEFWNVVGQLTDDVMPDEGWQSATYEPTIGEPDGANTSVRIVSCPDAESAAAHFADLVGLTLGDGSSTTVGGGFAVSTPDYTFTSPVVGSLHYQLTGSQSLSLAVVDVDIKQMPGLSQIVYKSPEQMQENGSFNGTAYYRFGDVVSKQNADGQTDYWVCVRPCFGPEGKGDSHWISFSKLPSANVKSTTKRVNGVQLNHIMPKNLCANQTHMQNLAELIYAMVETDTWAANLQSNYQKLRYFTDFRYKQNFKYNGDFFFQQVNKRWTDVFPRIFGLSADELRQELNQNGLNLVYNTATMSGNSISLPVASFSGTNLKTKVLSKKTSDWTTESFNIYDLTRKGYMEFSNFAGAKEKAWVVRYATGATLAKGSRENPVFDKYKRLPNCSDVVVFNRDVDHLDMSVEALKATPPKEYDIEYTGSENYYKYSDVYKDEEGNRWFVISMSGQTEHQLEEKSPYAELISFEGIKFSPDGSHATNLPSLEQAIRGAFWLNMLSYNTFEGKYMTKEEWRTYDRSPFSIPYLSLMDYADFNCTDLFQYISAQNKDPRQPSTAASIAYNEPMSNKQSLIRIVMNNQNDRNDLEFYVWKEYPREPSETAMKVTEFSGRSIYLHDLNDPAMVEKYGKDSYVIQPLHPKDGPVKDNNMQPRQSRGRADTDARSLNAANYLYSRTAWWNRTFPSDMWKSPVIMFRMTRVMDRGPKDYSTVTVDGHKLKPYHVSKWGISDDGIDQFNALRQRLTMLYIMNDLIWLDGKKIGMPAWKTAW